MVSLYFIPSLQTMALNGISSQVCCNKEIFPTIKANIRNTHLTGIQIHDMLILQASINRWMAKTGNTVFRNVDELALPLRLKQEVSENAMRIASEIQFRKYTFRRCAFYDLIMDYISLVCFSNFGEIDEQQTVEKMVLFYLEDSKKPKDHKMSGKVSPWLLLYMAYYYCATESIRLMELHIRQHQVLRHPFPEDNMANSPIIPYFLSKFMRGINQNTSIQNLYRYSIARFNFPAMKYFSNCMSGRGKRVSLNFLQRYITYSFYYSGKVYRSNVIVFLISQLNMKQQKRIFETYHIEIATFFLWSSCRESFLNAFEIISEYFSVSDVFNLLHIIALKRDQNCFKYSHIFMAVFKNCSIEWKKHIVEETLRSQRYGWPTTFLSALVKNNNWNCIKLVLSFA